MLDSVLARDRLVRRGEIWRDIKTMIIPRGSSYRSTLTDRSSPEPIPAPWVGPMLLLDLIADTEKGAYFSALES